MTYRSTWDLSTIPDELLWREVAHRRSAARPLKRVPEAERERLDRQREAVKRYRARLAQSVLS